MIKKQVAFLRGINVGNIRIKMTDLKVAFEELGFRNVKTYLQTGNVVFEATQSISEVKILLEKKFSETFRYEAYVLLYAFDTLAQVIAQYPFERVETHHAYIIFIDNEATFEELKQKASEIGEESPHIATGQNLLYWKVPVGQSTDTAFAKIVAKAKYKSSTTIRNINTLEKIVKE
jgi:uncharacterized protein (DUF1697 family)